MVDYKSVDDIVAGARHVLFEDATKVSLSDYEGNALFDPATARYHYRGEADFIFEEPVPEFLWSCKEVSAFPSLSAEDMIFDAFEGYSKTLASPEQIAELQALLDSWTAKQMNVIRYYFDDTLAVVPTKDNE